MAKNIVICCDGTNNQIADNPTNVLRLFTELENDGTEQVVFYDPGVGTLAPPDVRTPLKRRAALAFGLAFGSGLIKNLEEAYFFLMRNYEEDDRIFIFGFSRGAYTARGVAGIVHMFGVLHRDHENLLPYLSRAYASANFNVVKRIKKISRDSGRRIGENRPTGRRPRAKVEFLGLWDTVSAFGFAYARKTLPFTANNPCVRAVRHAMSIDERRAYFRQNRWGTRFLHFQNVKEVWFPGVHSDVGGGYPEDESGLAMTTLQWMLDELRELGEAEGWELKLHPRRGGNFGLSKNKDGKADAGAVVHESLKGLWWVLEYLPMNLTLQRGIFFVPRGRLRKLEHRGSMGKAGSDDPDSEDSGIVVHQSVLDRRGVPGSHYKPRNLPLEILKERVEPWGSTSSPGPPSTPEKPDYPRGRKALDILTTFLVLGFLLLALVAAGCATIRALDAGHWKAIAIFLAPVGVLLIGGKIMNAVSRFSRYERKLRKPPLHLRAGGYTVKDLVEQTMWLRRPTKNSKLSEEDKEKEREKGPRAYRRMLMIDLLFPIIYGPVLFIVLYWAAEAIGYTIAWWVLMIPPAIVMLCDWIENGTLLRQTRPCVDSLSEKAIKVASGATRAKIVGYGLCGVLPPLALIAYHLLKVIKG